MKQFFYNLYFTFAYRLKLKNKLLLSYFILIILPLVAFIVVSYTHVSKSLISQSQYAADLSLKQTSVYIDRIMSDITDSTEILAFNSSLSDILKEDASAGFSPKTYQNYLNASKIANSVFNSGDLYSMELFIDDTIFYVRESKGIRGVSFSSLNELYAKKVGGKLSTFNGKIMWMPPRTIEDNFNKYTVVTGARYLKDSDSFTNLGIITVNILQDDLNLVVRGAGTVKNSFALIFDKNGDVISVSDAELLQKYPVTLKSIPENSSDHWTHSVLQNSDVLLGSYPIKSADWTLVSVLPYSEILKTSTDTRNQMLVIMTIIGTFSYFIAYFISRTITKKINSLIARMKEVQSGNFSAITSVRGDDEMSDLAKNYNYMLDKINDYADNQYQLGQEVKSAELKALQAQINPHFLYNTLDLIHWISLENGVKEISEIVMLLSRFYKLSLNKGMDIIPIKNEILHIETYVKLQNYRFNNSINLVTSIDSEINDYGILKLLLQPIVENSILHGILEKTSKSGTIIVTGKLSNGILCFSIDDDGVGMTPEQISRLTDISAMNNSSGYGIKNVISRIKLYYGDDYGLTYESEFGKGTHAILKIPHLKME